MPEDRKTVQHKPERQKNSATDRLKTETKAVQHEPEDKKTVQQKN